MKIMGKHLYDCDEYYQKFEDKMKRHYYFQKEAAYLNQKIAMGEIES